MQILNTKNVLEKIHQVPLPKRLIIDYSALGYKIAYSVTQELLRTGFTDWRVFKYHFIEFVLDMKMKVGLGTEIIIACDLKENGEYWRAKIFPGYKKKRETQKRDIPKDLLKQAFKEFQEELKEFFPFRVISADGAEGDDIVAMVSQEPGYCNVILSTDYDLYQLIDNKTSFFYSLVKGFFIEGPSKDFFTFEKIVRGDASDNIPNIESDLDSIIDPAKRQKKLTNVKFQEYWNVYHQHGEDIFINYLKEEQRKRYGENKTLVDLTLQPDDVRQQVVNKINESIKPKGTANTAFKYCVSNSMVNLANKLTSGGF